MKKVLFWLGALGLVPALYYAALTIGYRADMVGLGDVFSKLLGPDFSLGWLIYAMGGGAVLALVMALVLLVLRQFGKGLVLVLVAAFSGAMAIAPVKMFASGAEVPPIHDITTDWDNPPAFVETAAMRTDQENPAAYDARQLPQQREGYPDLGPLYVSASPQKALAAAEAAAKEQGMKVVAVVPAEGRLEATHTSAWFGFKDDVAVRVTETAEGTRIDIRSKSRVGRSDLGANAARIIAMQTFIEDELGA